MNAYDKDVIIHVPMCGCYQAMNAQIALCAAEHLLSGEQKLHEERWQEAIASLRWEGRMERVAPHLVVDGAHNKGAIEAFVESMKALGESSGSVILFSAVRDKKYEQMIECLCSRLDVKAYVVTEVDDARRVPARELAQVFRRYTEKKVVCEAGLLEAIRAAEAQREGDGDVYCLGSLYLVGMIKTALCDLCK